MKKLLLLIAALTGMTCMTAQDRQTHTPNVLAADETPLYSALGSVEPSEGWGDTTMPELRDVVVEGYDGYIIIRGFAGVEGYDVKIALGANDAVLSMTSIVDGVEGETAESGYIELPTGREDFTYIKPYLASGYNYGSSDSAEESGYFITSAYIGDDWVYYFIYWPEGDEQEDNWVNPFEQEATFLYSAVGHTEEAADWGESVFPEVKDIKVDVYDTYVYIHAMGGTEGYDAMVAYNSDAEVLSIIGIANGEESAPCKTYLYLQTGREDFPIIQAYCASSYACAYDDGSGYVTLGAYIYDKADYYWSYYNLVWEKEEDALETLTAAKAAEGLRYNILGVKVDDSYKGFVIKDGVKTIVK